MTNINEKRYTLPLVAIISILIIALSSQWKILPNGYA